jgi:hypothetical protein
VGRCGDGTEVNCIAARRKIPVGNSPPGQPAVGTILIDR